MPNAQRADIYQRITDQIITAIEAGAGTCQMPWNHRGGAVSRPRNILSGKQYRGVNILSLWASAMARGYESGLWGTYRQWKEKGAQVRKGERGSPIVFYKRVGGGDETDNDEGQDAYLVARGFSVFNLDQVEGYEPPSFEPLSADERISVAERFFANLDIVTQFGGSEAFYRPSTDTVHMPSFESFKNAAGFYSVLAHECGHATGAKHRLDRDLSGRFGDERYAMEEALVEFAASFVMADLGIAHEPRPDHAAYISSWLKVLKADPKAVFTAASNAQSVADWMHDQQPDDRIDPSHSGLLKNSQQPVENGLSGYIAEMASAFVCASLAITPTVRHTDYIGSWLEVLREDKRAIFRAASLASKAADFILACNADDPATADAQEAAA